MIGWILSGVFAAAFLFLLFKQIRDKKNRTPSMWWQAIDGFCSLWLPASISKEDGEKIGLKLENVRNVVWKQCRRNYKAESRWTIAQVNVANAEPHKDHTEVMLIPAAHKIYLRLQERMYYWFARECHNAYRWQLHGFNHIYEPVDDDDKAALILTQGWIENKWGNKDG